MIKGLLRGVAIALFLGTPLFAQVSYDTVTATVAGPNGQPYAYASVTANLVTSSGQPINSGCTTPNGQPYQPKAVPGTLSAAGFMSLQLVPTNILTCPVPVFWKIVIGAPTDTAVLTYGPNWAITYQTAITAFVDLSSVINPLAQSVSFINTRTGQQAAAPPICQIGYVCPEQYGALGNGGTYFDGVIAATATSATATANSTAPSAPAVTTLTNGDAVLTVIFPWVSTWSAIPATGTNRVNVAPASATAGVWLSDQTIATAGSVPAVSGTLSGSGYWSAFSIPIRPAVPGGTVAFVGANGVPAASGSSSITVTTPAGVQNGQLMGACVAQYNSVMAQPLLGPLKPQVAVVNDGDYYAWCYSWTASNEPSSYTWKFANTSGAAAVVFAYSGAQSLDGASNVITSASAGFSPTALGNPFCLAAVNGSARQTCGTILSYAPAVNQATLSFYVSSPMTAATFAYGTDDTAALQKMTTTAPCSTVGCNMRLNARRYVTTGTVALPWNVPWAMVGSGAGIPASINTYGGAQSPVNNGSSLLVLTQNLTTPALLVAGQPGATGTNTTTIDRLQDFAIIGGAGTGMDGGGNDGLGIVSWQGLVVDAVPTINFLADGKEIAAQTNACNYCYDEAIVIENSMESFNGSCGIGIGMRNGNAAVQPGRPVADPYFNPNNIENVTLLGGWGEVNGGSAVCIRTGTSQGLLLQGRVMQWDNILTNFQAQTSELYLEYSGGATSGAEVDGNYFEVDALHGSLSVAAINNFNGWIGMNRNGDFSNNIVVPTTIPKQLTFTTANLPAASTATNANNVAALVTDATVCTNGTTYVGGGTVRCTLRSTGGLWVETGAGW